MESHLLSFITLNSYIRQLYIDLYMVPILQQCEFGHFSVRPDINHLADMFIDRLHTEKTALNGQSVVQEVTW